MRARGRLLAAALLLGLGRLFLEGPCCPAFLPSLPRLVWGDAAAPADAGFADAVSREQHLASLDVVAACVLLGFTVFVMGLFYLVNHPDESMRQHSWEVVSSTIAIFVAMLLFQGLDGVFFTLVLKDFVSHETFEAYCPESLEKQHTLVLVSALHFIFWFVLLQAVVARLTLCAERGHGGLGRHGREEHLEREQRQKCWAMLLSHAAAFAAIGVFSDLQRLPPFSQSGLACCLALLLHVLFLFLAFRSTDFLRNCLLPAAAEKGRSAHAAVEAWDEEAAESENEVAALSISYVTVRLVLYAILGEGRRQANYKDLPAEDRELALLRLSKVCILFVAMLFAWVRVVVTEEDEEELSMDAAPSFHPQKGFGSLRHYLRRWGFIAMDTSGMCFSWCLLYAIRWRIQHTSENFDLPLARTKAIGGICLAVCTSITACLLVFAVNWLCQGRRVSAVMRKQFRSVIRSLGILIGFAWEQCFDAGAEAIARQMGEKREDCYRVALARLGLAVVVAVVVLPAWRHHILRQVLALRLHRGHHH